MWPFKKKHIVIDPEAISPCRFCGHQAILTWDYFQQSGDYVKQFVITCCYCPATMTFPIKTVVIGFWNRRK